MNEKTTNSAPRAGISPALVAQAKAGDRDAFAALYEQTYAELYRSVRAMVRDEDEAWDILQDSYVRAWRGLDSLGANEAFLPWLRRIAVNLSATELARKRPLRFTELVGEEDEDEPELPDLSVGVQPEPALDRKENARMVREILETLPEEQQLIMGMRYYEDRSVREIAETLQIAPGTVKAQLFKGRKKVEAGVRALEKQGVKLYGLSPLPFLMALLQRLEPAEAAEQQALGDVLSRLPATGAGATGVSAAGAGTAGLSAAGAGTATTVTAMTAGQAFLHGLGAKLLAGGLAIALLVGGGKLAYDALKQGALPVIGNERPAVSEIVSVASETVPVSIEREAEIPPANSCGPDLTWRFDAASGTLTIEGSGEMYDYPRLSENDCPPWEGLRDRIQALSLPEGLSYIGSNAFMGCGLTAVTIPEGVTAIGEEAFSLSTLSSLTLPESLKVIEDCAFFGCSGLSALTIPGNVTSIGRQAFSGTGLSSVSIPEHVVDVSGDAFSINANLSAFFVDPENRYFTADANGVLYNKDGTTLVACPGQKSGHFEIPEGVTAIGNGAFYYCSRLSSVKIPGTVTTIGENAFSECQNLSSVTIPEGVRSIESWAFYHCPKLSSVTLPKSLRSIANNVFRECEGLTICGVPGSEAERFANENGIPFRTEQLNGGGLSRNACGPDLTWRFDEASGTLTIEGSGDMYDYPYESTMVPWDEYSYSIHSVVFPDALRSIGECAFRSCALTAVTIPEGVVSIGREAFSHCALRSVAFPESLVSIGDSAFDSCGELTLAALPKNLERIGTGAFASCNQLEAFTVAPENSFFSADEAGVLYNRDRTSLICCPGGKSGEFVIPDGVESIEDCAFFSCYWLRELSFPESVTQIGKSAFCMCTRLSSLALPESLRSIGEGAFVTCNRLKSVTIPKNVSFIVGNPFLSSTGLTEFSVSPENEYFSSDENGLLYDKDKTTLIACPGGISGAIEIPETVKAIGNDAFYACSGLSAVTIPGSVESVGAYAFYYCEHLTSVTIAEGLRVIGENAFDGCAGLSELALPASLRSIGERAFNECSGLRSMTIPEGVSAIGASAFYACAGLSAVTIPARVSVIEPDSFALCAGLHTVRIPDGVTRIGKGAFKYCESLESAFIPVSVRSIGDSAFLECEELTIHGAPGSEAERYADDNGIPFEAAP